MSMEGEIKGGARDAGGFDRCWNGSRFRRELDFVELERVQT